MKTNKRIFFNLFTFLILLFTFNPSMAAVYDLKSHKERLIGEPTVHTTIKGDYFQLLAEQYNVGFLALLAANPTLDPFLLKEGTKVIIPNQMLLPYITRKGIVINLPELRLYYFSPNENKVHVFPVGIGRQGLSTPLTTSFIGEKRKDPDWRPPKEMQKRHFEEYGTHLPDVVPAGPDNPFGKYALRLGTSEYLIHGSNKRFGIGMRASSGCIRMFDDDIKWLYDNVPVKTKVRVVNQPIKMSFENGKKQLIEIHEQLSDLETDKGNMLLKKDMQKFVGAESENWQKLLPTLEKPTGLVIELAKTEPKN